MPLQTFRYAACGGGNMALNIFIYFITYHYVFLEQNITTPISVISPHIAAYIVSFCFTFPIGFYLSMFVVFPSHHCGGASSFSLFCCGDDLYWA